LEAGKTLQATDLRRLHVAVEPFTFGEKHDRKAGEMALSRSSGGQELAHAVGWLHG
jgi:hypothetical protein